MKEERETGHMAVNSGGNPNRNDDNTLFHVISWIVNIILLSAFWPAGLIMLFLNLSGRIDKFNPKHLFGDAFNSPANKGNTPTGYTKAPGARAQQAQQAWEQWQTARPQQQQQQAAPQGGVAYTPPEKKKKKDKKRDFENTTANALLLTVGIVLTLAGIGFIVEAEGLWEVIVRGGVFILGGLAAFFTRFMGKRRAARMRLYSTIIGTSEMISVSAIAKSAGYKDRTVRRDLKWMIEKGFFGPDAYIDAEIDSLIMTPEAAKTVREFAQAAAQKAAEQRQQAQQPPQSPEDTNASILRELRHLDDEIKDDEISAKIVRIEDLSTKIFRIVREQPQKASQTKRFNEYYLPTTLKLLRSYSMLERQGIGGENIDSAKSDIGRILDTLIQGYEQQLDLLFQSDALDISSDIEVLETMLRNDGLTDDNSGFGTTAGGT